MKVLIVDDDRTLADVIAFTMRREGYEVLSAHDGNSALRRWAEEAPDLVLLDINLPGKDGFSVCKSIREASDVPIIMLTVRGEDDDVVRGLELGADDYIAKPFSPRQLVARAGAVLRRAGSRPSPTLRDTGDFSLDQRRREVRVRGGDPISLTPLEARLLEYLLINSGMVLTVDAIIDYVWGPEGGDRDMVRQVIHRLRSKIEPDPSNPTFIETVPGIGYGLNSRSSGG
jgi:DNA-binding response OmpR family regulator